MFPFYLPFLVSWQGEGEEMIGLEVMFNSASLSPCAFSCLMCRSEANGVLARKCAMPRSSLRYPTRYLKFKKSISGNGREREILN